MMNANFVMALGSFMFAAVNLHKEIMPMFAMWTAIAFIQCVLGVVFK